MLSLKMNLNKRKYGIFLWALSLTDSEGNKVLLAIEAEIELKHAGLNT